MKDTKDDTDGKIHPVPGLEKSILSKWLHYPSQWLFFAELKQKIFKFVWKQKTYNSKRNLEGEKNAELEESGFLTSDYTTKLQ